LTQNAPLTRAEDGRLHAGLCGVYSFENHVSLSLLFFWTNNVHHFPFVKNDPMLIIAIRITQLNSLFMTHLFHFADCVLKEV
jgi:hypothetical protein